MELTAQKIDQAIAVLQELGIDLWLTIARESQSVPDPVLPLIVGQEVIWLSAFFITRAGRTVALVGSADAPDYQRSCLYQEVVTYKTDVGEAVRKIVADIDPRHIAVNYSPTNYTADGLSHGLYCQLMDWLAHTDFSDRVISADEIIARVRGRKNAMEIERIGEAAQMAHLCWEKVLPEIQLGMTEIAIARLFDEAMAAMDCRPSFETIVNAGAKTAPGHGSPTEAVIEGGDLLHVDFGVLHNGYCSDIQRVAYFCRESESAPPAELTAAFGLVREIIDRTAQMYRPGVLGHTIDAVAREMLKADGHPVFDHGLGHQLGRAVHDGAAIVGPLWPRYGRLGAIPLEANNTFTVELGIPLEGIGYMGLEEDLIVTPEGGRFLGPRQLELPVI